MNVKKLLALLLAVVMVFGIAACHKNPNNTTGENTTNGGNLSKPGETYTYRTYTSALATNWNPHTWEMNADSDVIYYTTAALVDTSILDSENGVYQWIYVAASSVEDVTKDHQDDLTKYGAVLPDGVESVSDVTDSYVYEIKLRPEMCWEDGTPIDADTYIYSMQQLLDPVLSNYRANNYYSGEGALAGAYGYFFGGKDVNTNLDENGMKIADLTKGDDGVYTYGGKTVRINVKDANSHWLGGYSLETYVNAYGEAYFSLTHWEDLTNACDEDGYVALTDETLSWLVDLITGNEAWGETEDNALAYIYVDIPAPEMSWDTVGLYKVDDYTIRYVCQTSYAKDYFLGTISSCWLVHEELYESCKQWNADGTFKGSTYGTSLETSMSCGAYKITVLEDNKQMVYEQNENYFEYTKNADGTLSSTTEAIGALVDGKYVEQYLMQKMVVEVMNNDAAKLAFLKGDLDDWSVSGEDAADYATSEQLYKVDQTYTMRLFFHTNLESLKEMDKAGNTNSVVLSNENFRKAMSLAIDRAEFVQATAGYKAAYSMFSSLYYYDFYNDPTSVYRNTEQAMQAICNLYGVEYGEGKAYKTLEEAYKSINGYNVTEAKKLMTTACEELVAAGLYKAGEPIVIQVAYTAGASTASSNQQITLLNKYMNAAVEGTGFGTITLQEVNNLDNRYSDVASGTYAIGYGAWGGAAFYPFQMFRVYCDDDYVDPIHEAGCWDPSVETLTLTVNGEEVTMTWKEWSKSLTGTGVYANAEMELKLTLLAAMEEELLEKYYFIPLASMTSCSMLSYKISYYTENYNIMYGFGGIRLIRFNYSDAEWTEFVKNAGSDNIGY